MTEDAQQPWQHRARVVAEDLARGSVTPAPSEVTEDDQRSFLAENKQRKPELELCSCDAAPYLHITALVPATIDRLDTTPVRTCLVVQVATETITVLRITGGSRKDA